jgi:hypothetical protein
MTVTRRLPGSVDRDASVGAAAFSNKGLAAARRRVGAAADLLEGRRYRRIRHRQVFRFLADRQERDLRARQAFRRRLDAADPPMWTHADKNYLLAGTASGELVVGQINQAAGLSGDNIRADRQSSYGSKLTWPVAIGTSIMWVQRGGRKIREAEFDYSQDRFVGANINIYARHITRSGIKWLAFQQEPEEMLWGGRGDGTLIAHPHNPSNRSRASPASSSPPGRAFRRHHPVEDGTRDELWILADLDGDRAMLQLAEWWDEDAGLDKADAFFVDWGVSYDGAPQAVFTTGLDHLEGRQVRILADGAVVEGQDRNRRLDHAAEGGEQGSYRARLPGAAQAPASRDPRAADGAGLAEAADPAARAPDRRRLAADRQQARRPRPLFRSRQQPRDERAAAAVQRADRQQERRRRLGFRDDVEIINDDPLPCLISQLLPTYELEEIRG